MIQWIFLTNNLLFKERINIQIYKQRIELENSKPDYKLKIKKF